ncbi:MAG: hypothetical protein OES57_18185, partial [Acidimicrobiia bacterium]|nr:hypothetical protein [Acidimicrobiia bacterium]
MARTELDDASDDELASLLPPDGLDVAQLEAWASAVVGSVDDLDAAIEWLSHDGSDGASRLLGGLAVMADEPWATRAGEASGVPGGGTDPEAGRVLGTAEPVDARVITKGGALVIAVRWRHVDGTEHTLLTEVEHGCIESIRVAGGDLFEALDHEPDQIDQQPIELDAVVRLLAEASVQPVVADEQTWANVALAGRRFERLGMVGDLQVAAPPVCHPGVEADPESAAYAIDVLGRAIAMAPLDAAELETARFVAQRVRPLELHGVDADTAHAVAHLEWADWLGAVIGLVRAGPGSPVVGDELVVHVNRCPEVTTGIPRVEQREVAACFTAATAE